MSDSQIPQWLKYSAALVLAVLLGAVSEFPLPSPQDPGWSPLIGLVHAVVVGAAFSLIVVSGTILLGQRQGNVRQSILHRGGVAFLLFAGSEFVVDCLARPFFSGLSGRSGMQNVLASLVRAGGGRMLPLTLLIVFIIVVLIRYRRA